MKDYILIAIFIFFYSFSFSQEIENDTVFVKKSVHFHQPEIDTIIIKGGMSPIVEQVIIGTRFLPGTDKLNVLLNKGLRPISLELVNGCDDSFHPENSRNYPIFNSISRDSSVLTINVSVTANCCRNFLGEAEIGGTDTLNLTYISYGGNCACTCCFTLEYKFDTEMEKHYNILKYVTINGSKNIGVIPNE